MTTMSHLAEYLRNVRRRKTKTIFERGDTVQVAYTPQPSILTEREKASIRRQVKEDSRYNWPKILLVTMISAGIAYLVVSLVASIFTGNSFNPSFLEQS